MEASAAKLGVPTERFIQVVEIWRPDADGSMLEIAEAHYGACAGFGQSSLGTRFARGRGLPGKVWESGGPMVLEGLMGGVFERVVAAADAGLGAGLGFPIVVDGEFRACVLMLFGVNNDVCGVTEVWERQSATQRLTLRSGFHGALTRFARDSQGVHLEQGRGLPGLCWSAAMPIIVEDVGHWQEFVRRVPAEAEEVTTGVGIPFFRGGELTEVVTMLGTRALDLASRVEVWDTRETFPRVTASADALYPDLESGPGPAGPAAHMSIAGAAAADRMAKLEKRGSGVVLALPIIDGGSARAVITFDL